MGEFCQHGRLCRTLEGGREEEYHAQEHRVSRRRRRRIRGKKRR